MSTATIITLIFTLLQTAGVVGSFDISLLTTSGLISSSDATTMLKSICQLLSQSSQVETSVSNLASQIVEWCDGDTSYSAEDLIAQCETIASQSDTIQALT